MRGSTPFEVLEEYARPTLAALLCVTQARLKFGVPRINVISAVGFGEDRVPLRRPGTSSLLLSIRQQYRVEHSAVSDAEEPYRVRTASWYYTILDHREQEILAYHWHPDGLGDTPNPHFHVGSAILDTTGHELGKTFSRLHLPSGHITIANGVRALIEELGVQPIHDRWDETLRACQEVFERQRTGS